MANGGTVTVTLLLIAMPCVVVGAITAFLITYAEMHHHLDHRRAVMEATRTAVFAFVFMGLLACLAAVIVPRLIQ